MSDNNSDTVTGLDIEFHYYNHLANIITPLNAE